MKRINALILTLIMSLTLIFTQACGIREEDKDKEIDPNKTQLYVGNFYGALGSDWFSSVIERFETDNPTVQVFIDDETDAYTDANLINRLGGARQDIYFTNGITYANYAKSGKLADLTEVVTTPMNQLYMKEGKSPFTDAYTIEASMNDTLQEYYKTDDNKYYAIPFYEAIFGLIYDIDLFENKKLFFRDGFEDNANLDSKFITSITQKKSKGIDGIFDTYDDGLPSTYSQYKALIEVMKKRGVTPYIWNKHLAYRQRYLLSIWADYEGKEKFDLNNSFSGNYTFEGDSAPTTITENNANLLMEQAGHKYALQFAFDAVSDPKNYYSLSFDPSNDNVAAQDFYLDSSRQGKPVGMITEASWFENEARTTFEDMATSYGEKYARGTRRFGMMPVPKADNNKSSPDTTLLGVSGHSVICIDAKSKNLELAKKFLAYCQTQQSLADFTVSTGVLRAYDYDLSESQKSGLTELSRNLWNMYKADNAKICYNNIYTSEFKLANPNNYLFWGWNSIIDGALYNEPFDTFNSFDISVDDYIKGSKLWASDYVKK